MAHEGQETPHEGFRAVFGHPAVVENDPCKEGHYCPRQNDYKIKIPERLQSVIVRVVLHN